MWVRRTSVSAQVEDGASNSQYWQMIKTWNCEFSITEEVQVVDGEDWTIAWVLWLDGAQKHFYLRLKFCDVHRITMHYRPHIENIALNPMLTGY